MPSTKPYIRFNHDGICEACEAHEKKRSVIGGIDWSAREKGFEEFVLRAKSKNAPLYDALVPVSGGKDSITQVHRLLKYDLRILAVNVDYGIKTEIGRKNLDCIPDMGAHLIIFRPEQKLHKELIRKGLEDFGDPDLLSHTLLHAYPLHMALSLKIPLAVLGENSAFEYGGDKDIAENIFMTKKWFLKYAANKERDARFISKKYNIPYKLLKTYDYPDELKTSETQAVFLSYFFNWDSETHLNIAKQYGFKELDEPREGTYRTYVGIDEKINRIHQYLKVLKFGYGRATDHACEDIRNERLDRDMAKKLVKKHDLEDLSDYYIDDFCTYLKYTKKDFFNILEQFRDRNIWKLSDKGNWEIPNHLEC
jgi:N-acetyl sugar amidotransferase